VNIFGVDGWEIEVVGLGRTIHDNGRSGQEREYLCFAEGYDEKRYIVLVAANAMDAVATVEGMPGKVEVLPEVETTRFDGFQDFPEWEDARGPADWLQGLMTAGS
jgi:hypothetical protein